MIDLQWFVGVDAAGHGAIDWEVLKFQADLLFYRREFDQCLALV